VVFYAQAADDRYNTNNIYFPILRRRRRRPHAVRDVTRSGEEPALDDIIRTARVEKDTAYYSTYPVLQTVDHFFDGPISVSTSTPVSTLIYTPTLVYPVTAGKRCVPWPFLRRQG